MANSPLNAVYALKEQRQQIWHRPDSANTMKANLEHWGQLVLATGQTPMKRFVATLRRTTKVYATTPSIRLQPPGWKTAT